jgi:spore coat protein U-like protein
MRRAATAALSAALATLFAAGAFAQAVPVPQPAPLAPATRPAPAPVPAPSPRPAELGRNLRCTFDSVTGVAFGSYDTSSPVAHVSAGRLRFSCRLARATTMKVLIGPSAVSGSISDRQMRQLGGSDVLHYNLFQDTRGSIVWGDGINGGNAAFISGSREISADIHGAIRPRQQVSEGVYLDALRITLMP